MHGDEILFIDPFHHPALSATKVADKRLTLQVRYISDPKAAIAGSTTGLPQGTVIGTFSGGGDDGLIWKPGIETVNHPKSQEMLNVRERLKSCAVELRRGGVTVFKNQLGCPTVTLALGVGVTPPLGTSGLKVPPGLRLVMQNGPRQAVWAWRMNAAFTTITCISDADVKFDVNLNSVTGELASAWSKVLASAQKAKSDAAIFRDSAKKALADRTNELAILQKEKEKGSNVKETDLTQAQSRKGEAQTAANAADTAASITEAAVTALQGFEGFRVDIVDPATDNVLRRVKVQK